MPLSSAQILRASRDGLFELVVSELLLAELERTLDYPKLRKRIHPEKTVAFANWVQDHASFAEDQASPPPVGRDPRDDYLLSPTRSAGARTWCPARRTCSS